MSDIDYDELSANLDGLVVLDVRSREEVKKNGQIPGSHCLPDLDEKSFQEKYGFSKPSSDQSLVTHCMMGGRAKRAGDALIAKGLQARVYVGSFNDWNAKGGKVDPGCPFEPAS
ncbi:Thiosulfate sulfurtransferase/rhodanese-like domain-containing protein 3-like 3 [Homarus americanus]|uniref:Thiosulfate sulfurtransferase/rhodanese-like domain-containing protein 3-like 3 n=1 Tax=Homarus americanus TaxID=6706 RepID=A0A8J5NAM7_HOMAM|nr:Thiosulfate sulfurtransferase/rhodanese-like domain-containing protein 3-like 3 [Homarus americanus]